MKNIILGFLLLYSCSFAIVDFEGIEWGDTKNDLTLIFPKLNNETSLNQNITILSAPEPKEGVKEYKFFFRDNSLYKIRVVFDKESTGRKEIQDIYQQLLKNVGSPVSKVPIDKKVDNLTLKGNSLKFIPDLSTNIYFNGVDTINEFGKMIDSNLYLEYINSNIDNSISE